ncbi:MAG: hypothetical protein E6J91_05830 [Deltaproteobacteria bacterium]|nr:MAG: hypothetical protein E6J91_05830 [Deltaproteobacteria bacterium]
MNGSIVPGVAIGAPKTLVLLPAFSTVDLAIPVTVQRTVANGTSVTLTLHVAADQTCDHAGITVTQTIVIGTGGMMNASGPERVVAASAMRSDAVVLRTAPVASLRDFDAGVCILQGRP